MDVNELGGPLKWRIFIFRDYNSDIVPLTEQNKFCSCIAGWACPPFCFPYFNNHMNLFSCSENYVNVFVESPQTYYHTQKGIVRIIFF